jgi:PhnB protein
MQVTPYLFFNGNCREAFEFYEKTLGGKIVAMMTHNDSPIADCVGPEHRDSIIHARLELGGNLIFGSDDPSGTYQPPKGFSVTLGIEDRTQAEATFKALAEGGSETMPYQETFFAHGFGMLKDKYGIPWMVVCEKVPVAA